MKPITFTRPATKTFRRIPAVWQARLITALEQHIAAPGSTNNVTQMVGSEGFRLRVGDWRIVFIETAGEIVVIKAGPRGSVYD